MNEPFFYPALDIRCATNSIRSGLMLYDVNVSELVQQITNNYINESQYSTLRQDCLNKSPIPSIITSIKEQLAHIVKEDKMNIEASLINEADKAQIQDDLNENEQDRQQEKNDLQLKAQLESELLSNRKKNQQIMLIRQGNNEQISQLKILIKQLEQQISNHQHPGVAPQGQIHEHPQGQIHEHPANDDAKYSLEKQKLIAEKKQLEQELYAAESNLATIKIDARKLNARHEIIINTLDNELPLRVNERNERYRLRMTREKARLEDAPINQRLSYYKHKVLLQNIAYSYRKLDEQAKLMLEEVTNQSYQVFLSSLKIAITHSINLGSREVNALKQIIKHMQDHLLALERKATQAQLLIVSRNHNANLISKLEHAEKELGQLKSSNPTLNNQNKLLHEQNCQLEKAITERSKFRNKLFIIGALALLSTGGLIGATLLAIKLLSLTSSLTPLFFIPAGLVAIATLGLFIASLVYTIQNSLDKSKLKQNIASIEHNDKKIVDQNKQIIALEQSIIPDLKTQINNEEKKITALEKEIDQLDKKAILFFNKAQKITPLEVNTPGLTFSLPSKVPTISQCPKEPEPHTHSSLTL